MDKLFELDEKKEKPVPCNFDMFSKALSIFQELKSKKKVNTSFNFPSTLNIIIDDDVKNIFDTFDLSKNDFERILDQEVMPIIVRLINDDEDAVFEMDIYRKVVERSAILEKINSIRDNIINEDMKENFLVKKKTNLYVLDGVDSDIVCRLGTNDQKKFCSAIISISLSKNRKDKKSFLADVLGGKGEEIIFEVSFSDIENLITILEKAKNDILESRK